MIPDVGFAVVFAVVFVLAVALTSDS